MSESNMKRSLASISLILFGVSIVFLVAWTAFESALPGMSTATEQIITVVLLILPAGIGAVVGTMSLMYREGKTGLAITGIILNTLFAIFHLLIVLFAG
jgi:hypothetical protein